MDWRKCCRHKQYLHYHNVYPAVSWELLALVIPIRLGPQRSAMYGIKTAGRIE